MIGGDVQLYLSTDDVVNQIEEKEKTLREVFIFACLSYPDILEVPWTDAKNPT